MSETYRLTLSETCSQDEQNSTTQEVSSADNANISTKVKSHVPVINAPLSAVDVQPEQQVNDGDVATGNVELIPKTDEGSDALQYERYKFQMIFGDEAPEAKHEALLTDLVENGHDINKVSEKKVAAYGSAINAIFRSTMIQGVANRAVNFIRMMLIGHACLALKPIVKSLSLSWEEFVKDHFGPELLSTIGTYMRLANIDGVKNHSYLGKDRLLKVLSIGKKLKNLPANSIDLIGDVLHQLKINPINIMFDDVLIFNKRVDAALFAHKIEINGITVNHQSVIDLASTRFNFKDTNKHLKKMCYLKDNTDNPNAACQKYLNNILTNNGIYTGSALIDDSDVLKGEDDFINSLKESYASIRTSFHEGKELSTEEKGEIKTLIDYLTKLIA